MNKKIWAIVVVVLLVYVYSQQHPFDIECPFCDQAKQNTLIGDDLHFLEEADSQFTYSIIPHLNYYTLKINTIPSKIRHKNLSPYLYQDWSAHDFGALPDRSEYRVLLLSREGKYHFGWCDNVRVSCATHEYEKGYIEKINVKLFIKGQSSPIYEYPLFISTTDSYRLEKIERDMDYYNQYYILYETHIKGVEAAIVRTMIPVTKGFISEPYFLNITGRTMTLQIDSYGVNKIVINLKSDKDQFEYTKDVIDGTNEIYITDLSPSTQYRATINVQNGESKYGYPVEQSKTFTTKEGLVDYDIVTILPQSINLSKNQCAIYWKATGDNLKNTFTYYKLGEGTSTKTVDSFETEGGVTYFVNLERLDYSTTYRYSIRCEDTQHVNNFAIYSDSFTTPLSPTTTTYVLFKSISVDKDRADIKFEIVGDFSKVEVNYRQGSYGTSKKGNIDTYAGEHIARLTNLKSGNKYEYVIEVTTRDGKVYSEGDFTTSTATGLPPSPTPPSPTLPESSSLFRILFLVGAFIAFLCLVSKSFRRWFFGLPIIKEVHVFVTKK